MHAAVVVILKKWVQKRLFSVLGVVGADRMMYRTAGMKEAWISAGFYVKIKDSQHILQVSSGCSSEVGHEEVSLCLSNVWAQTADNQTIQINSKVNVNWKWLRPSKSLMFGSSPLGPSIQLSLRWDCGNGLSDITIELILHQRWLTKYILIVPNKRRPFSKTCYLIILRIIEVAELKCQQILRNSTSWLNDWEKMSWYRWICSDGEMNRCPAWWSETCLIKQMNSFCLFID